jgi:hypothetical protein
MSIFKLHPILVYKPSSRSLGFVVKWEHLTVVLRFDHQTGKIRETMIGTQRKTFAPEEQITLQEYLKRLSQDGWGLSTIVGVNTYLFARRAKRG